MKNIVVALIVAAILLAGCAKRPVYRPMVYLSRVKVPAQVRGGVFIPEHTEYVYILVNPNDTFVTRGPLAYAPTFLQDTATDTAEDTVTGNISDSISSDIEHIPDSGSVQASLSSQDPEPQDKVDTLVIYYKPYVVNLSGENRAYIDNFFTGKKVREVVIETFTDSLGSPSLNLRLSKKRAENIKSYVKEAFGIKKVIIRPRGATNFIYPNDTEYHRLLNRRAVITAPLVSRGYLNKTTKK